MLISPAPPIPGGSSHTMLSTDWASDVPLKGRVLAVRRRRLALRVRDWLGIGVIAAFSVTLFAVTFFSLVSR